MINMKSSVLHLAVLLSFTSLAHAGSYGPTANSWAFSLNATGTIPTQLCNSTSTYGNTSKILASDCGSLSYDTRFSDGYWELSNWTHAETWFSVTSDGTCGLSLRRTNFTPTTKYFASEIGGLGNLDVADFLDKAVTAAGDNAMIPETAGRMHCKGIAPLSTMDFEIILAHP